LIDRSGSQLDGESHRPLFTPFFCGIDPSCSLEGKQHPSLLPSASA